MSTLYTRAQSSTPCFPLSKKSTFLRKKKKLLYPQEHACYMHEMFIDLSAERHPVLQAVSSYVGSNILYKYMYNFSIYVQATHQQGCFGNKLSSQIVCQCLRAMSPAHLDMNERAKKQNV